MGTPDPLRAPARTAIETCVQLHADESCAIITDDERVAIADALYTAAADVTDAAVLVRYPPGEQHGTEPPDPVAEAMVGADVFLAPTTKSLSHTRARGRATDAGARGATLPGITESVFVTGLDADYDAIADACDAIYDRVAGADTITVRTERGTNLVVEPGERPWYRDTGLVHDPGAFSNLPAGEVFVAPATATGTVVVDGTIMPHGLLDEGQTVRIEVEDGYVTDVSDPAVRDQVEAAAAEVGRDARNFAELGIGANIGVSALVGSVLLDEKAAGTVHVAIGDDAGIGGETDAPIHLDGVIREPEVVVDGDVLELPGTS